MPDFLADLKNKRATLRMNGEQRKLVMLFAATIHLKIFRNRQMS
jgi:hypothetical protein